MGEEVGDAVYSAWNVRDRELELIEDDSPMLHTPVSGREHPLEVAVVSVDVDGAGDQLPASIQAVDDGQGLELDDGVLGLGG